MYCRGDEWAFDCFDDSSDAWPTRPDAADVGDFVAGLFAEAPFGQVVAVLELVIVRVLGYMWHRPIGPE